MPMTNRDNLISAEAVGRGHPDKLCDQISDTILDLCMNIDSNARVAVETLIKGGDDWCKVVVAGEISVELDPALVETHVRQTLSDAGYNDWSKGCQAWSDDLEVINLLTSQSADIAQGVDTGGAGDQGIMYGYATNETLLLTNAEPSVRSSLAPIPHILAHRLLQAFENPDPDHPLVGKIGPDLKSQVTARYDPDTNGFTIEKVVLALQHDESLDSATVSNYANGVVRDVMYDDFGMRERPNVIVNGTGRFVKGGPCADAGLTGRKIIVDTYGGLARHGGGAFSGKDPTKVDRSGAYAARWAAKHVVASGLAERCEIQIGYVIGFSEPVSIHIDTFGTGRISDEMIADRVHALFDFAPRAIIERLQLRNNRYLTTSFGGHFGREANLPGDGGLLGLFTWEALDANILRDLACTLTVSRNNILQRNYPE